MQCCSILSCQKIGFVFRGADPSLRETPKCYLGKRERQGEGEGERERDDPSQLHGCEQATQNIFTVLNNQQ